MFSGCVERDEWHEKLNIKTFFELVKPIAKKN